MQEGRKILAVAENDMFSEEMMNYSIHLAQRLSYDLIALNVKTSHNHRTDHKGEVFKRRAAENRVRCEYAIRIGDMAEAVEEFHHETRRVELVIAGSEAHKEEMTGIVTIPVFSIVSNRLSDKEEKMATETQDSKTKLAVKTMGYGLLTAVLYAAVFMNAKTVMQYFTKGNWYAALPIATVFVFSFAHGAFASNLWSLMGINAAKKDDVRQTVQPTVRPTQRPRKRPRVRAYVNPFHRI